VKTGAKPPLALEEIEARLKDLPGVRSVDLQNFPQQITIRCDASGVRSMSAEGARVLIGAQIPKETEVLVEQNAPVVRSRRARFESVKVTSPEPGRLQAHVTLEWQGQRFDATADDESSPAGELRSCAAATIRAIEKIIGDGVIFHLIGVKEIRIFDHDLVAVLIRSRELPQNQLVGTSVNIEDRRRSTAVAVLSATNRSVSRLVDNEDF
jgi:hypothetical protein